MWSEATEWEEIWVIERRKRIERKEEWVESLPVPTPLWVNKHEYSMGLLCLETFYTFSNVLNNFNRLTITYILEMRTVTFRDFSKWCKVTPPQKEIDPGIKPRSILSHRLWDLLYHPSAYPCHNVSGMILDWRFW